ncbi:MAG TPA: HAMP domain-containing sensor histidine kinase [Polyangiales bacterium]
MRVLSADLGRQIRAGSALTELLLPESRGRCQRFLHMAAQRGASVGCELTVLCADGPHALRFVAFRIASDALAVVAARDAEVILALLGAHFDPQPAEEKGGLATGAQHALEELGRLNNELVNDQRELAKEQSIAKAQAQQRSDLLATVAHDLRTPMAVVLGYCDVLRHSEAGQSGQTPSVIQRVCASVQYALDLLGQTLEYAKLESGALTLHLSQTDLGELTSNVVEMHRALAKAKDIRIEVLTESDVVPPIWIDRVLIEQAVGNLLTNAIKYSPHHTTIQVDVECDDGQVRLVVRDQGLGIDPVYLPLVFRPFQTTSTQATAGEKSTGLGLAIVQRSAEAHGGAVEVRSTPMHGSTFVVTLPIKPRNRIGVTVLHEAMPDANGSN